MKSNAPAAVFAALALFGAACSRTETPAKTASAASAAGSDAKGTERYAIKGEVIKVLTEEKQLRVKHEEIKGYMPAMLMDFPVDDRDLAAAKPGQHIRAEMVVIKGGGFRLEKIWPDEAAAETAIAAAAKALREDTHNRGKNAYREIGEAMPNFTLYDQEGRVVPSGRFTGKQIMVNFIFTRCPIATMCPASTAKMMQTQKQAREAGVTNIEFVSFTLDPAYDTPAVLKEYAQGRGIDTVNFSFLTGPENAIKDLLAQFGVIAEFDGDLLKHTLATLLIGPNGQIVHRADGSAWEAKEFVAKMKK